MVRVLPQLLMVLFFSAIVVASIAAADGQTGQKKIPHAERIVAKVGDRELTLGELMIRFATLPQQIRDGYGDRLNLFLEETAANIAVAERAKKLDVENERLFEILMTIRRDEILRDLYARRTVLAEVDEATLQRRYREQLPRRFRRPERLRIRQILVTSTAAEKSFNSRGDDAVGAREAEEKARRIHAQLSAGKGDFAILARELSEDASAPSGGELGWVGVDELEPSLGEVAAALEVGELSEVIETPFGFHILEVLDRRAAGDIPLNLVHELLFQEVVGEKAVHYGRSAAEDRDRLVKESEVELFPELLPW